MDSKETYSSGLFGPSPSSATRDDDNESIGLSSARASPPTGFSMDSYMQNFYLQQLTKTGSFMSPQSAASPPMSLRARESSAMALKYIFDQQINNNASSREQRQQQMGGFQAIRNQSMPDLRKRNIPDLDLSFKKAQDSNLQYVQKGFGSPISTPTNQSSLPQAPLPPMSGQLGHHNYMPQAAASTRPNPSSRLSTAQMTVFYAGNVNVYDDVPADKAHAIMLLAGNSWSSSSFKCPAPPPASAAPVSPPAETMMMRERAPSPIKATPSQHASVTLTIDRGGAVAKSYGSPGPVTASLASPPPSPALQAPSPVADGTKSSQAGAAVKRPHAGIELPHARKASLARFLEKRKDRVHVQQDQQGGAAFEKGGGEPTSGNDKPDHVATSSSSKKHSRSRSPSPSGSIDKEKSASNNATYENPSMNERRFFH